MLLWGSEEGPAMLSSQLILPASRLLGGQRAGVGNAWVFAELAGHLTELSAQGASATLTVAMRLAYQAQCAGEPVAWVTGRKSCFYPPDALENGVDLEAMAVVRVPEAADLGKAADYLVRSGAFGLVVLDLGREGRLSDKQLTRLLGLARKHGTAVVCLTAKPDTAPSLGALVSLRAPVTRSRSEGGGFEVAWHALKDKRRTPGWRHAEVCRGPAGLR
jgi:recombination protein RecA